MSGTVAGEADFHEGEALLRRRAFPAARGAFERALAAKPDSAASCFHIGGCHYGEGANAAAQEWYHRAAALDPAYAVGACFRADADFRAAVSGEALPGLRARLAPVEFRQESAVEAGRPLVFVGCDSGYFLRFVPTLAISLARAEPGAGLHLHVVDPVPECAALVGRLDAALPGLGIGYSQERPDLTDREDGYRFAYLASIRFVRLAAIAARYDRTILSLDADSLVRRPLRPVLPPDADIALRVTPPALNDKGPFNQHSAAALLVGRTPAARAFLDDFAAYIAHFLVNGTARWLLDQVALSLTLETARKRPGALTVTPLGEDVVSVAFDDAAAIWMPVGDDKATSERFLAETARLQGAG